MRACSHSAVMTELICAQRGFPLLANGESEELPDVSYPHERVQREPSPPTEETASTAVDCTVFAPDRVGPTQSGILQVFLHTPTDWAEAEARARTFDAKTLERAHKYLALDAPTGSVFLLEAEIDGFELGQRVDTVVWNGSPQAATFPFKVPDGCGEGPHVGTVWISQDGHPVGRISFQIEVLQEARVSVMQPTGHDARHYNACFCSYSSKDRVEVLKRIQGIQATGLETFVDAMTLRPGDDWNDEIFSAIDESDLFVLMWSSNARASEWVLKEALYARTLNERSGCPDFRPIPIEGPPIAPVPHELSAKHFNDQTLYMIRAAELEAEEWKQETRKE
jgi:hypothetical protein